MTSHRIGTKGFTLVEILVVLGIFGVFSGAIYSLYIAQMKTAFTREDVVDVQQNVRIAMDRLTFDVRMGGFLSYTNNNQLAISTNAAYVNYSSILRLQTASADASFVKITSADDTTAGPISVSPPSSLNRFKAGEFVRVVRPLIVDSVISPVLTVAESNIVNGTMTLNNSVSFRRGDVICKVDSVMATYPETITYSVAPCDGGNSCLTRSVNGGAAGIIAQNIKNVSFSYLLDDGTVDGTETKSAADLNDESKLVTLRAIRVTVIGQTFKKSSPEALPKIRQLTSVVRIRNRR